MHTDHIVMLLSITFLVVPPYLLLRAAFLGMSRFFRIRKDVKEMAKAKTQQQATPVDEPIVINADQLGVVFPFQQKAKYDKYDDPTCFRRPVMAKA